MKNSEKVKKTVIILLLSLVCVIAVSAAALAAANAVCAKLCENFISSLDAVEYESRITPAADSDGCFTFTTDGELKVMQLTDIHIGGGLFSRKKDLMALNAAAAMISEEKPDLVIVTGDIAFPSPNKSGTLNNKTPAVLFADLMEQLGVYWAPVFGNHDTESYSYYSREDIGGIYSDRDRYPHSLFCAGPEEIDGCGNYIIKVKNTEGEITQCFVLMDSHSYAKKTAEVSGGYDNVHENQIDWYESELKRLEAENKGETPPSLLFFHIPTPEFQTAWDEYQKNGETDSENVEYVYGTLREDVCCSQFNSGLFERALETGSTKAIFCGHDHVNNFYIKYKGIGLVYSYSIDYLAYSGINGYGAQRGCTVITVKPDGSFECRLENYYQDKYQPAMPKESVLMSEYK